MKNILYLLLLAIVGAAVYYFVSTDDSGTLSEKALTDYAIADTSMIGMVKIDDGRGQVTLTRGDDSFWKLNDDMVAMPHHVETIMKTFSNVRIQSPVAKSQKEQVLRIILGDTRKVEIYDLDGNWMKTWYVGRATQTNQGTYALLETPEEGRSTEPYILEMGGFRGYLTTRFHAIIDDWRWTGLFYYPDLDFKSVKVETPKMPELGFTIDVLDKSEGEFRFTDHQGQEVESSKSDMAAYLGGFKKINVEHFKVKYSYEQRDSLFATKPDFRISVTGADEAIQSADIWYRKTPVALASRMGDSAPAIDPERVMVSYDGDLAYGQRIVFDQILHVIKEF